MKLAAAQAIAAVVPHEELAEDYVVPSVFNGPSRPRSRRPSPRRPSGPAWPGSTER